MPSGGPSEDEDNCDDGIDNDGDGLTDNEDNDCDPGGPGGTTGPGNQLARGGNNDNGNNDNGNSDNDANSRTSNVETERSNLPEAIAQIVQVAEGQIDGEIYYILIENVNNETSFVPDKVTLPSGFTIVWINNDSKDHHLVITDENGKPLLDSVVTDNDFINYKFESEGMFFYSDSANTTSNGIVTIVANGEADVEISGPLPGIETIISSLGFK